MKKVLALVLAVVMSLGMMTVSFAATSTYEVAVTGMKFLNDGDKVDNGKNYDDGDEISPGRTIYIPLFVGKDSGYTSKLSDLGDYKISYTMDDGKNMIESVKFASARTVNNSKKELYIAIKVKDNFILEDQDVNMTIKITSKSKNANFGNINPTNGKVEYPNGYAVASFDISFKAQYNTQEDLANGYVNIDKYGSVATFADDADDVTLMLGDKENVEVQGNMKGQKKVFVRLDTSNAAMEDKYPEATIRYFAGDKDTFRRDVTVTIPYDASSENPYLYVADAQGRLTKLCGGSTADKAANETGVKYDEALGAFVFKTKTLGNYVISDTELKNTTSDENVDVEKPTPDDTHGEPNPGTGANDFVGLAAAVAAISLAGIVAVKRSK